MSNSPIYISFLNYLGGFEYFYFTAFKEFQVEISDSGVSRNNILNNWPNSYNANADTIEYQTYRTTRSRIIVRSQHLSEDQRDVLMWIKKSPLVQIINGRTDRKTVIVDTDSFKVYDESDKTYAIQFAITDTSEEPAQRV